jgi:hypothetical protein
LGDCGENQASSLIIESLTGGAYRCFAAQHRKFPGLRNPVLLYEKQSQIPATYKKNFG